MARKTRFNDLQEEFILWNAERLDISHAASRERFRISFRAFPKGHRGYEYRKFNGLSYRVYAPFHWDNEEELEGAYIYHSNMHFLRMLSYGFHVSEHYHEIVEALAGEKTVKIIDYGCGLAQGSFWFAGQLKDRGVEVSFALVDFPTLRRDFLEWKCRKDGIKMTFLKARQGVPVSRLPKAKLCIATEFFEHVDDPVRYFDTINKALHPGAWLISNVADHRDEFMHVSPELADLRARIRDAGFETKVDDKVFLKAD